MLLLLEGFYMYICIYLPLFLYSSLFNVLYHLLSYFPLFMFTYIYLSFRVPFFFYTYSTSAFLLLLGKECTAPPANIPYTSRTKLYRSGIRQTASFKHACLYNTRVVGIRNILFTYSLTAPEIDKYSYIYMHPHTTLTYLNMVLNIYTV